MLTPVIFFNLVLQMINAFQTFTQSFVVSGGTGGPVDSTLFYTLYIYTAGIRTISEMGYASAMAWVLLMHHRRADRARVRDVEAGSGCFYGDGGK